MIKIIVDGNNIANRAFFAFQKLSTIIDGTTINTGVIYGFTKFIVDLAIRYQTGNITIVWDSGSSYRKRIYPEYKAGRDHSHYPDMMLQMDDLNLLLSVMNINQVRANGYEADDVIYTIITNDKSNDTKIIFSSDKDFLMFIRDDVIIHQPGSHKVIDVSNIYDVYNVPLEALLDFFALKGDKVDNIGGVPGIGDKTAQKIIAACGSIDIALKQDKIDGVQPSKVAALKKYKDDLDLSLKLISPILVDEKEMIINMGILDETMVEDILLKYAIKTIRTSLYFNLME